MGTKKLKKGIAMVLALNMLFTPAIAGAPKSAAAATDETVKTETFNYAKAFNLSMYFYDANKCGPRVKDGLLSWRGDCHLEDAKIPLTPEDKNGYGTNLSASFIAENKKVLDPDGNGSVDLTGGYHDAGDHVKFGLPQSYAGSTVGWGYYEFRDSYVDIGAQKHMEDILRWFNDYFLKCTFRDADGKVVAFAYQVGDGSTDHNYWGPPELQKTARPAYFATSEAPASDQCADAAASLAINYLNFKESDPDYAKKCLDTAIALYEFAKKHRGTGFSGGFYNSSFDEDEMSWAAVWLNIATGQNDYIIDITSVDAEGNYTGYMKKIISTTSSTWQNIWVHSWDTVWGGVFAKLAPITNNPEHWYFFRWNIEYWAGVQHEDSKDTTFLAASPDGFRVVNTWGSARYNTAAQLCALVYNKHKPNKDFVNWCKDQMDYILGDNPMNRCYEVGYAENSAKHPHHRAAHGSDTNSMLVPENEKHVLWGALVGGPDASDKHKDDITDYVYNEVAIDYNAGFVGALAALYAIYGKGQSIDSTVPAKQTDETPFYVTGKIEQENAERTQVTVKVTNDTGCYPRNVSTMKARYYFDISEMMEKGQTIKDLSVQVMYDQAKTIDPKGVTIKGPVAWNPAKGIYYVELDWSGISFHGSREIHFGLVPAQDSAYKVHWDPSNDWSREGLKKTEALSQSIPLYMDNKLIYGKEPAPGDDVITEPSPIAITSPAEGTVLDTTAGNNKLNVKVEKVEEGDSISKIEVFADGKKIGESDTDTCDAVYTAPSEGSNLNNGFMDVKITAKATMADKKVMDCSPVRIKVKYKTKDSGNIKDLKLDVQGAGTQSTNTISKKLILSNTGNKEISLSNVKLRYYFTKDSEASQVFYCDYAGMETNSEPWHSDVSDSVDSKFVSMENAVTGADTYLELSFDDIKYVLASGKKITLEIRIGNSDWSNFDQENDYSNSDNDHVVLLADGTVISGVEPK